MFKPLKLGFANQNNRRTAVTHPSYSISAAIKTTNWRQLSEYIYRIGLPNKRRDKKCYKQTHTYFPHYKNCHFDINSILSKKWYQHITIFWAGSYGFAVVTYVLYLCYMWTTIRTAVSRSWVAGSQATDLRVASAMWRPRAFECSRFLCSLAYQNFEYFSIVQQIKVSLIWTSREISDLPKYFYIEHIFIYKSMCAVRSVWIGGPAVWDRYTI